MSDNEESRALRKEKMLKSNKQVSSHKLTDQEQIKVIVLVKEEEQAADNSEDDS